MTNMTTQERPTRPGWWLWWDGRFYQQMIVTDGRQATTDREHLCARKRTDTYTVPGCGYPVDHFWRGGWWVGPFESEKALIVASRRIRNAIANIHTEAEIRQAKRDANRK